MFVNMYDGMQNGTNQWSEMISSIYLDEALNVWNSRKSLDYLTKMHTTYWLPSERR